MPAKTSTVKAAAGKGSPVAVGKPQPGAKAPAAAPAKPIPVATVTLKQFTAEIAGQQEIGKQHADTIVNGLVGILVQHLKSGDRVRIGGLGVLEVKDRPERAGRNPATGEAITIKASKKITFRPAKELKEAI